MAGTATDLASSAGPRPSLEVQLGRHAAAMILAAGVAVITGWNGWVAFTAAASFSVLWRYREPSRSGGGLGVADALTGTRFVVVAMVAASIPETPAGWVVAALAFNVVVDALDGHVAKKLGETTQFGAVFDRETDAFFVLVAYLHFHLDGWLGAWVLFAAILPYAYRLLASAAPTPVEAGHRERLAVPLAGLNFVILVAAVAMPAYSTSLLAASVTVVCVSFGASFWSLRRAYSLP